MDACFLSMSFRSGNHFDQVADEDFKDENKFLLWSRL